MARYRKRDQVDERLADDLEIDGRSYTVDYIAKKATGVTGYRVTVAFIAEDGDDHVFVDLDPVDTRPEAEASAEVLSSDRDGLVELFRRQRAPSG